MSTEVLVLAAIVGLFVVLFSFIQLFKSFYRNVSPNEVLVISGGRTGMRLVSGGGSLVNPLTERIDKFSLETMTIEFVTPEVYSAAGVPVIVDAVAQVKVENTQQSIETAVERFLSKSPMEIKDIVKQTLEGHTRAIIGGMSVEEIIKDREAFAQQVTGGSRKELGLMGLTIDSFSIKDIRDTQGYLAALGKPQTAEVKMRAAIAEAERARDAQKAAAAANQEAEIAKIDAKTKIAEKDRDYRMMQADYNKASKAKEAEADLAYELQKNMTQQRITAEEVQIQIIQKEKEIEVQEKEVLRKERELEATVFKPADARKYEIETLANAEQFKLKATAEGQSEAYKLNGFAKAEVVEREGRANAESSKMTGVAQADVQRAQGLAQAEVIRETGVAEGVAMARKAESWKSYNEAAILQMLIEKLPEIASAVTAPLSKTEKIIMISGGDGVGVSKFTGDVTKTMAQLPAVLEALTGLKLDDLTRRVPALAQLTTDNGRPDESAPPPKTAN